MVTTTAIGLSSVEQLLLTDANSCIYTAKGVMDDECNKPIVYLATNVLRQPMHLPKHMTLANATPLPAVLVALPVTQANPIPFPSKPTSETGAKSTQKTLRSTTPSGEVAAIVRYNLTKTHEPRMNRH